MRYETEIEQIRHSMIEAVGRSVGVWGLNETYGRLFGLLYFADEPLSLDEMAEQLAVSKATISISIRVLEKNRAVQKVWKKGSRKDYYVVERDFERILQELMKTNAMEEMRIHKEAVTDALDRYNDLLKENCPEEVKDQIEGDLAKLYEYIRWLQIGEKWIKFFIQTDVTAGPSAGLKRIQVEWEDEE